MRQALLLIETSGKPAERVTGDFASMTSRWKSIATPDTHATLYELRRVKHKHVAALPQPAAPPPQPKAEPTQPQLKKSK